MDTDTCIIYSGVQFNTEGYFLPILTVLNAVR